MQEVSMAAWRQSILIKAVTRALRLAFGVGARVMFRRFVERDAECIHLGASFSEPSTPKLISDNVFLFVYTSRYYLLRKQVSS